MASPPDWMEVLPLNEKNLPRIMELSNDGLTIEEWREKMHAAFAKNEIIMVTFTDYRKYLAQFN